MINIKCTKCGLSMTIPMECIERLKDTDIIVEKDNKAYIICPMPKCGNHIETNLKGT